MSESNTVGYDEYKIFIYLNVRALFFLIMDISIFMEWHINEMHQIFQRDFFYFWF